jgi:hypothetical protein
MSALQVNSGTKQEDRPRGGLPAALIDAENHATQTAKPRDEAGSSA